PSRPKSNLEAPRGETSSSMGYMCDWFAPGARVIWERTGDGNCWHPRISQCVSRARTWWWWMAYDQVACGQDGDYIFASPDKHGTQPYWPNAAMEDHILPAVRRAGIQKRVRWHTFRHTFGA